MGDVRLLGWLDAAAASESIDWDAVYRDELPRVYNFFRYRVLDRATAEDLTSTTFEKAWRARSTYKKDRASPSTWLLSIARNVAVDHYRRSNRPEIPLTADIAGRETPESDALKQAELRRLITLLAGLEDRERELLALKYGAEATNRAIAALTGLTESNVGTILHRTIAGLRAAWEGE
jgi:RNA polymerase sigma-70 factor (ECF subfamily)